MGGGDEGVGGWRVKAKGDEGRVKGGERADEGGERGGGRWEGMEEAKKVAPAQVS